MSTALVPDADRKNVVPSILMQPRRHVQAGFTLAELMVVVIIVGVLSAVGVTFFRKHALASKVTEAQAMVQSIRAAEERYRAENRQYLNVIGGTPGQTPSLPGVNDPGAGIYYPASPDGSRRPFFNPVSDTTAMNRLWRVLNPTTSGPVQFGYAVAAGLAGVAMSTPGTSIAPSWPTPTDSWYVIQADADNDKNGVYCVVVGTSLNGEVYVENEGE